MQLPTCRRFDGAARRTRRGTPRTALAGIPAVRGREGAWPGGFGRAGGAGPCNETSDGGSRQQQRQGQYQKKRQ